VKSIRRYGSGEALLACLAAVGLGLSACGGQGDVVRAPTPSKVAWNDSGDSNAGDGSSADTAAPSEGSSSGAEAEPAREGRPASDPGKSQPPVIDLDAPPSKPHSAPPPRAAVEREPAEAEAEVEEARDEEASAPEAAPAPEPESPASDPLAAELRKRRAQAKARSEAKRDEPATKKRAAAAAAPTKRDYGGSDPCRAASFSVSRVREACASGGRTAAKRLMKEAIGKATATGQLLKCGNCHANQSDYTLKSNAAADLERWLGD
jgi:hypothetical protein